MIPIYQLNYGTVCYILIFAEIKCVSLIWCELWLGPSLDKSLCATALAVQWSVSPPIQNILLRLCRLEGINLLFALCGCSPITKICFLKCSQKSMKDNCW